MAKVSEKLIQLINEQIRAEYESAYIYLEIANYYEEQGWYGFAGWFNKQYKEEVEHAEKFIKYVHEQGYKVVLEDIRAPKNTYKDLREPLAKQLEHEELVTSLIYGLMDQAVADKDYRSQSFLKWYVDEQTEEEEHSHELIELYDRYSVDPIGMIKLDKKLGKRVED